jgi:diaminohydroxyphosphoribosylaminopyrimidine deaminase/5-amino-6-(5-phosphoribosylamino)uracil reductase
MRLRSTCEAILAGAGTIRQDDPALTVRGEALRPGQLQPWRAILTKSGNLPPGARIFTDEHAARTLVFQNQNLETVLREDAPAPPPSDALARLRHGYHLGGKPLTRDEAHAC